MDGNGRWAAAKGLPRLEGHRRGAERLIETVDACIDAGVNTLTVFAFSAENWKRPLEEVSGLFKLGEWILRAHLARLEKRNVRLHVIGDITALPDFVRSPLADVIKSSKDNTAFNLVVALNYGARQEIVAAARALARLQVLSGPPLATGVPFVKAAAWQSTPEHIVGTVGNVAV